MDYDRESRTGYSHFAVGLKWILLTLSFFLINTCREAPRTNPLDPDNPDTDIEAPPLVTNIVLTQVNMGFELSWSKVDSTIPNISGHQILRSDSVLDQVVDFEINKIVDTEFEASDSGSVFHYEIRVVHTSGLLGEAVASPSKRLVAIPIDIEINLKGVINGVVNANPTGYTDQRSVFLEVGVNDGVPSHMMVSESPSFTGVEWRTFQDTLWFTLAEGDGLRTLYAKCKDITDHESNVAADSARLDTSPPKNTGVTIIPINNTLYADYPTADVGEYTPHLSVELNLEATDLAKWRVALNNGSGTFPANPSYTDYTDGTSLTWPWVLSSDSSITKVYARFEDELGHIQDENVIAIDQIVYDPLSPPTENCSVIINNDQEVIAAPPFTDVHLNISAQDAGESGIYLMRLGNSSTECINNPWEPYTSEKNWGLTSLLTQDGYVQRRVFTQFRDRAGNIGPTQPVSDYIWVNPRPSSIQNFRAETSYQQVKLLWDSSPENDVIAGGVYIIEKAPSGQAFAPLDTLASSIVEYIDTDVQNGTSYSYNIWAVDSTGVAGSNKSNLDATPNNQPPSIAGFVIMPDTVGRRETVFTFSATSALVNDDHTPYADLKVQWKFKAGDAWSDMTTRKDTTHTYVNDTGNEYEVSLKVTDLDGANSTVTRRVRINRPPNQPTLSVSSTNVNKKVNVDFTANATDDDNDLLEYYFEYGDDESSGWIEQNVVPHSYAWGGTYSARVITRDTWIDSSSWSTPKTIIVINNAPDPPAEPNQPTTYKQTDVAVSATLRDPDNDMVKLIVDWGGGDIDSSNFVDSPSSVSITKSPGYSTSGTKDVSLTAKDKEGKISSPTTTTVSVVNRAPDSPVFHDVPSFGYTCETVSVTVSATDPDGDQVRLFIDWGNKNDDSPYIASGEHYQFSNEYNTTVTKYISVYAEDNDSNQKGTSDPSDTSIPIKQRPPDINNPSDIDITYPATSGFTTISNTESNTCGESLTFIASESVNWLSISPTSGTLGPGNSEPITATVNWSYFNHGEIKSASITINSNDPDAYEASKTVNVTGKMTYPVCNFVYGGSGDMLIFGTNQDDFGSVVSQNRSSGDDPCNAGKTAIKITDVNGSYGYFKWTVSGKSPEGRIKFYIEDRKAEDKGIGASEIYWEFWFDGVRKYYGTYDESDGCTPFNRTISGSFNNIADHVFEILVYDQTLGAESLWMSRLRIEWCGWFVDQYESNCTGCN